MPSGARPDPPNRSVKAVFSGRVGAQGWSNVMWLYLPGSGEITHSVLIALADGLFGEYSTGPLVKLSTGMAIDLVQVVLWADGEEFAANSTHVSVAGSQGGSMLPANVAACVSWPIPQHYKGGHPRTYFAGIPSSAVSSERLFDLTWATSLESQCRIFHTGVEALSPGAGIDSVEHGIISFVHSGAWRTPPIFRRIQQDATVDRRIDTQRRRLGRDIA